MDPQAEVKRLATPTRAPSFWRFLWEKNYYVYFNVPMCVALWVISFAYFQTWWMTLLVSALFALTSYNVGKSFALWRKRVQWQREDEEWVTRISSGPRAFPAELAWTMLHLINEDKTHVAARVALDYLTATDPETRRWVEEFKALPQDEQDRRSAEALAIADDDIRRKKQS